MGRRPSDRFIRTLEALSTLKRRLRDAYSYGRCLRADGALQLHLIGRSSNRFRVPTWAVIDYCFVRFGSNRHRQSVAVPKLMASKNGRGGMKLAVNLRRISTRFFEAGLSA